MSLKLNASGGGSVTLQEPTTASNYTLYLPAVTATVLTDSAGVLNIGSGQVYKDAAGNVGIGTASPNASYRISIQGNASTAAGFYLNDANASRIGSLYYSGGNTIFYDVTNAAERARIDASGNLLVGTTSQYSAGYTVSVAMPGGGGIVTKAAGTSTTYPMGFLNNSGSFVGSISYTTTATAYNTSSDYRLKDNIQPMTGALAKVAALKPSTYRWKADGSDGEGFIAHELQAVVPQCVTGEKDAVDSEGNPVYQGIDTSFLVATLTAAIQELKAEVDSLRAQVEAK